MTHYLQTVQTALTQTPWNYSDLLTGGFNAVISADYLTVKVKKITISVFLAQSMFALHNIFLVSRQPFFERNVHWLKAAQWGIALLEVWNLGILWTRYDTQLEQDTEGLSTVDVFVWKTTPKILAIANAVFILLDAEHNPHQAVLYSISSIAVVALKQLNVPRLDYLLAFVSLGLVYHIGAQALPYAKQLQTNYQPALLTWTARIFSPPSL